MDPNALLSAPWDELRSMTEGAQKLHTVEDQSSQPCCQSIVSAEGQTAHRCWSGPLHRSKFYLISWLGSLSQKAQEGRRALPAREMRASSVLAHSIPQPRISHARWSALSMLSPKHKVTWWAGLPAKSSPAQSSPHGTDTRKEEYLRIRNGERRGAVGVGEDQWVNHSHLQLIVRRNDQPMHHMS